GPVRPGRHAVPDVQRTLPAWRDRGLLPSALRQSGAAEPLSARPARMAGPPAGARGGRRPASALRRRARILDGTGKRDGPWCAGGVAPAITVRAQSVALLAGDQRAAGHPAAGQPWPASASLIAPIP